MKFNKGKILEECSDTDIATIGYLLSCSDIPKRGGKEMVRKPLNTLRSDWVCKSELG